MKTVIFALTLFSAAWGGERRFESRGFSIRIDHRCPEGCVSCNDVRYVGISKKTGNSITLTGSTVHTMGADGVTPSQFQGYLFKNGATEYFVSSHGYLEVTRGDRVLVNEEGKWDSDYQTGSSALPIASSTLEIRKQSNPQDFFTAFRAAVLSGQRELVASVVKYPMGSAHGSIKNRREFLEKYDLIFSPPILNLLRCASAKDVEKFSWRGYTISRGALWFDGVYFGSIIPKKDAADYLEKIDALLGDRAHWHMRVMAVYPEPAACENLISRSDSTR